MELQLIGQEFDEAYLKDLHRLSADKRVSFRHDCEDSELVDAYRHATCTEFRHARRFLDELGLQAIPLTGQKDSLGERGVVHLAWK